MSNLVNRIGLNQLNELNLQEMIDMGRRSDYKKDRAWTAWDMNCRRVCPVKSKSRRKLRDILRRQSRKRMAVDPVNLVND